MSAVYDMVFYSPSFIAKNLFKKILRKCIIETYNFDESKYNQVSFVERTAQKEIELFYYTYFQCKEISNEFEEQDDIPYDMIERFVNNHEYISMDTKRIIDGLIKHFNVQCSDERSRKNRTYSFPKKERIYYE
jgi:hypothetical protein